jgi:hypothetical protein
MAEAGLKAAALGIHGTPIELPLQAAEGFPCRVSFIRDFDDQMPPRANEQSGNGLLRLKHAKELMLMLKAEKRCLKHVYRPSNYVFRYPRLGRNE